jgi:hypothetical protein
MRLLNVVGLRSSRSKLQRQGRTVMNKHAWLGLVLSLSVVIGVGAAARQSSAPAAGHWEGTIQAPGQALAIVVDLALQQSGTWTGAITIPGQGVKGFALSPLTVDGNAVTFGMKGIPGDPLFKGTLSTDPHSISGEFSQAGATMPFSLAWKGEPRIEAPPPSSAITKDLEGSWEGTLTVQGNPLRLVLDLANEPGGGAGTLTTVDQGGARIPIAQISQSGAHVTLLVSAIGASYEGSITNGQIDGTWAQSGRTFPLVFKRASK